MLAKPLKFVKNAFPSLEMATLQPKQESIVLFSKPEIKPNDSVALQLKKIIEQYELIRITLNTPVEINIFTVALIKIWFKEHFRRNDPTLIINDEKLKGVISSYESIADLQIAKYIHQFTDCCSKRNCVGSSEGLRFSSKFIAYLFLKYYTQQLQINKIEFSRFLWQNLNKCNGRATDFLNLIDSIWTYIQFVHKNEAGDIILSRSLQNKPEVNLIQEQAIATLKHEFFKVQDIRKLKNSANYPEQLFGVCSQYIVMGGENFYQSEALHCNTNLLDALTEIRGNLEMADLCLKMQQRLNLEGSLLEKGLSKQVAKQFLPAFEIELIQQLKRLSFKVQGFNYFLPKFIQELINFVQIFNKIAMDLKKHLNQLDSFIVLDKNNSEHKEIINYQQQANMINEMEIELILQLFVKKDIFGTPLNNYLHTLNEYYQKYQKISQQIGEFFNRSLDSNLISRLEVLKDIFNLANELIHIWQHPIKAKQIVTFIQQNNLFKGAKIYFTKNPVELIIKDIPFKKVELRTLKFPISLKSTEFIESLHPAADGKLTDKINGAYVLKSNLPAFKNRNVEFLTISTDQFRLIARQKYFLQHLRNSTARVHNNLAAAISRDSFEQLKEFKEQRVWENRRDMTNLYKNVYGTAYTACHELVKLAFDLIQQENVLAKDYFAYLMRLDNNAEEKADNHDHNFVGVYSRKAERFMQLEGIIDLWTASVYPAYEIFIGSSSEYVDLLKNSVDNKYIQEGIKEDHITFF